MSSKIHVALSANARHIWQMNGIHVVKQLSPLIPKFFSPGADITVNEQLVAYRGRCTFQQYQASKPAKYGVKSLGTGMRIPVIP